MVNHSLFNTTPSSLSSPPPPPPGFNAKDHDTVTPFTVPAASPSSPSSPSDFPGAVAGSDNVVHRGLPLEQTTSSFFEPATSQPYPHASSFNPLPHSHPQPLSTPLDDVRPDLAPYFAASALPPLDVSPPIAKNNLRLPSFHLLGIAAPHPDRIALPSLTSISPLGAGPLSKPEDPLHALSPPLGRAGAVVTATPEPARATVERLIPTVTPPNEPGTFNWGRVMNVVKTAGSPPSSNPEVSPSIQTTASASSPHPVASGDPLSMVNVRDALEMSTWIETIKEKITSELQLPRHDSVKILSHALPCPSTTGHLFGQIISAIHDRSTTSTDWINVFHAVPGRYTLSDLPKSPPSTPGQVIEGDEYFTSKVFDTAVAVPDYQLDSKLLPPSPRPVVPPGSVNVSLIERYIPPTNANEFSEMFSIKGGHSLLLDRLTELSCNNGILLFIYPTKTGARTFTREYLGPIFDPLLRTITIVHDLSSDLGKSLGPMTAVDQLAEYAHLHRALERFCDQLSQGESTLHPSGTTRANYTITHASREEMIVDRKVWARDWWIKQEKPRVREVVTKYFRKAKNLPNDSSMTPTNLIQEVLDGVVSRDVEGLVQPRGIELGVFIIKKTASRSGEGNPT